MPEYNESTDHLSCSLKDFLFTRGALLFYAVIQSGRSSLAGALQDI